MTSLRIVFRPQAEAETLEARRWYDDHRAGLGDEFGAAIAEVVARVVESPLAFPRVRAETRRAILRRFPYAVYFRASPDEIVVLGVIHGRRDPRRWKSRS